MLKYISISLLVFCSWISCSTDLPAPKYKTKNVIIIIMDGPRWTETWGDSTHQFIPHLAIDMKPFGEVFTNFFNLGPTYTDAGHTEICTGFMQEINNTGGELPAYPGIFQYFLKATKKDSTKAWVITSKDKLAILANTKQADWNNKFRPSTNCGNNGLGTGYCDDSTTFRRVMSAFKTYHPNLMIVNFKQPDAAGHQNNWQAYMDGIKATDNYVYQIWEYLQTDPNYKNTTTFIYTNDHGRHCDGWQDGFVSHGDTCRCCRHINLYMSGPDFKKNEIISNAYDQCDIPFTVAELLGFKMEYGTGKIISDVFKKKPK